MMRQTGGSAVAATSTRSSPLLRASCTASRVFMMPSCSPSSAMTRTCGTRMRSLMRVAGARRLSGRPPRPRNPAISTPPEFEVRGWRLEVSGRLLSTNLRPLTSDLCVRIKGSRAHEAQRQLSELFERHRPNVAPRSLADGHLALLHLAVAQDEHEGNLLQLCVAYLRAYLFAALVPLAAQPALSQRTRHAFGVLVDAVCDGEPAPLHGREP